jgi:hypothetical protein
VRFREGFGSECASLCANLEESETETVAMIRQAFGEESRPKRAIQVKRKVKGILNIFLQQGQVKQSTWHTTVAFYGDCVKMCEDFAQNFGDERTGCCITITHRITLSFH